MSAFKQTSRAAIAAALLACAMCSANAAGHGKTPEPQEQGADGWQLLSGGGTDLTASDVQQLPEKMSGTLAQSPSSAQVAPAPSTAQVYSLAAGDSIEGQLLDWAKRAGWTVLWKVSDAWVVPGNKNYGDDFETAVKHVTEDLAANGADIVGDSWRDNHTIVITQNGAAEQ